MLRNFHTGRKLLIILLIFILSSPLLSYYSAVSSPYQIYGVVTDSTGNPAYSVEINVSDVSTGTYVVVYTNREGKYSADLSEIGSYSDGDTISVSARIIRNFYGRTYHITGSGGGIVDTDDPSTRIDVGLNQSLSILSGSVEDFLGNPVDSIMFNLTDLNTGDKFSEHLVDLRGYYQVPLCVLSSLSTGDQFFIEANSSSFSFSSSFLFSGGLLVIKNITLIDDTPPMINSLYPESGSNLSMSSAILFHTRAADDDMVSSVTLYYSYNGYFESVSMQSEENVSLDWNGNGTIDSDIFGFIMDAPGSPGNLSFYVSAEDRAGNTAYFPEDYDSNPYVLHLTDTIPPMIERTPLSAAEAGLPFEIYAEVHDDWQVNEVRLNYTDVSGIIRNVSMASGGNGSFSSMIDGQPVGVMSYSIAATDGTNWNSTQIYTLSVMDTLPPRIEHNPINSMNAGTPEAVVAGITDISGLYNATLHYLGVNSTIFADVPMSVSGENFTAMIPSQPVTGELFYFITCDDGKNAARFPDIGNITVPVFDAGTPVIKSWPVSPVDIGLSANITAEISDDIGVSGATLYYNLSGSAVVHGIAMSPISGDGKNGTWVAHLPAQSSPVIIWYRIEATDGTNNITYPYRSIQYLEVADLSPPEIMSVVIPFTANISSSFSVSIDVTDNYEVTSAAMVEVSENGTWFTRRPMSLGYGSAVNGTWNLSISFDTTGKVSFFFEVSDGPHTIRYPDAALLSFDIVDNIPPVIGEVAARPQSHTLPAVPGDRIVVEAYLTDNVGVKDAILSYLCDGNVEKVSMVYEGSHVFYALSDTLEVPGDFLYSISVSDGFNSVRSPSEGWDALRVRDFTPPMIIHNIPQDVEAGRSAFISGSVWDDFNVSSLSANYRFVSDDGKTGQWISKSVPLASQVVSGSGVYRNFSLRLPSFFRSGTIEFNMSASDGYNVVYSPADFAFSIKVMDTTPPAAYVIPTATVYAGNESRIYVVASDLSGITSVTMKTSGGRNYRAEYLGSDASGNGTYLFRVTSETDVHYRLLVSDGNYNTLESPDSGYYLLRFDSSTPFQQPATDSGPALALVLNPLSIMLFIIQALAISLILLHRKLI